jgi:hypothetical protein
VVALPRAVGGQRAGAADAESGRNAVAQLRLLSAVLRTLSSEFGPDWVGQLLQQAVEGCTAGGGNPGMQPELVLMATITSVLTTGDTKRKALVPAALVFCHQVWAAASQPGAEADVDVGHVKAAVLAALLQLVRHYWRLLAGADDLAAAMRSSAGQAGALPLRVDQQAAAAAALFLEAARAGEGANAGAPVAPSEGAAVVGGVLQMLLDFFAEAAEGHVLVASDVRAVLEELFDTRVAVHLFSSPLFLGARAPLADSLLRMLLSRLYGGAQEQIIDTLHGLASSMGWTEFQLTFVPSFVQRRLPWMGARGGEVGAVLGADLTDLDAAAFETAVLKFVNDVLYWQQDLWPV